jgi:hypothetical protein
VSDQRPAPDAVMASMETETDPLPDAVASAWDVEVDPPSSLTHDERELISELARMVVWIAKKDPQVTRLEHLLRHFEERSK